MSPAIRDGGGDDRPAGFARMGLDFDGDAR